MANVMHNALLILGEPDKIRQALRDVRDEESGALISFRKVKPVPEEVEKTSVHINLGHLPEDVRTFLLNGGDVNEVSEVIRDQFSSLLHSDEDLTRALELIQASVEVMKQYGVPDHQEWRWTNWGTNLDAYETYQREGLDNAVFFSTSWSTPHVAIQELSKQHPDLKFVVLYADEDFYSPNCGIYMCQNGEIVGHNFSKSEDEDVVMESEFDPEDDTIKFGHTVYFCSNLTTDEFNAFADETLRTYLGEEWKPERLEKPTVKQEQAQTQAPPSQTIAPTL